MDTKPYLQVYSWKSTGDRLKGGCCSDNSSQRRLHDNSSQPRLNDNSSQPRLNDNSSQPRLNDNSSQQRLSGFSFQHRLNDSNSQPRLNDSNSQPRLNDNTTQQRLNDNSYDKYTAAIELSNKCREFYKSRLQTASDMKSRWNDSNVRRQDNIVDSDTSFSSSASSSQSDVSDNGKSTNSKQDKHRIDQAMEKLRTEMVSLMDQDLSLMKQLLTLNEIIEELKWQRQHYTYSTSWTSFSASNNLESNFSVSDTDMYESEDDTSHVQQTSCCSIQNDRIMEPKWHKAENISRDSIDLKTVSVDSDIINVESASSVLTSKSKTSSSTRTKLLPIYPGNSASFCATSPRFTHDHHTITSGTGSIHHERGEDSFDSGIHEVLSGDELTWSN